MLKLSKNIITSLFLFLLYSDVYALSIGSLKVNSSLNQPLNAEISLEDIRGVTADEIVVSLAPSAAFRQANIVLDNFLLSLKFEPIIGRGRSYIKVTSSRPIQEPYLHLLLEVAWPPKGRILREFTALIDPPLFDDGAQPSLSQSNIGGGMLFGEANTYRVQRGDTAGKVVSRFLSGVNQQQALAALQKANPDAFIKGNINLLKNGSILRIPNQNIVDSVSRSDILALRRQNSSWRDMQKQINATYISSPNSSPSVTMQDSLSIVSSNSTSSSRSGNDNVSSSGGADVGAIMNKLAQTQEQLDTERRNNAELTSRLNSLESQLEQLNNLLNLQNSNAANLQNNASNTNNYNEEESNYNQVDNNYQSNDQYNDYIDNDLDDSYAEVYVPPPPQSFVQKLLGNKLILGGVGLLILAALAFFGYKKYRENTFDLDDEDDDEEVETKKKFL